MSKASERAVRRVLEWGRAWDARDIEAILAGVHENILYQNVPMPVIRGRDGVRAFISPSMARTERVRWDFLNIVADDGGEFVLTERIDHFFFPKGKVAVPVMGVFRLAEGGILEWRDYADLGNFSQSMAAVGEFVDPNRYEAAS
jgi:limonene-1,2-epoxide hydrolase